MLLVSIGLIRFGLTISYILSIGKILLSCFEFWRIRSCYCCSLIILSSITNFDSIGISTFYVSARSCLMTIICSLFKKNLLIILARYSGLLSLRTASFRKVRGLNNNSKSRRCVIRAMLYYSIFIPLFYRGVRRFISNWCEYSFSLYWGIPYFIKVSSTYLKAV
jgi:hypothetical protein